MAKYPMDPNYLISAVRDMNDKARTLRDEGWTVKLQSTDDGSRVWLEISATRSCDPPPREDAE